MANPKIKSEQEPILSEKGGNDFQAFAARTVQKLRPHLAKIVAVLVGVVIVIAGLAIWQGITNKKAAAATKAFTDVIAKATARTEEAGPQIEFNEQGQPQISAAASDVKTYAERNTQALALVQTLESSHGGTDVASHAQLVKAGLLYDEGKYDEAAAAYKAFVDARPPVAELAAVGREGYAYALEAKALAQTDAAARTAGLDAALQAFAAIEPDEKGAFFGRALYHRARITALKGDKAAAIELYKKSLEKDPDSDLADEINSRLALLEAK